MMLLDGMGSAHAELPGRRTLIPTPLSKNPIPNQKPDSVWATDIELVERSQSERYLRRVTDDI